MEFRKSTNNYFWKTAIIYLFPLRDAASVMLGNMPLRFGEIFAILFSLNQIKKAKIRISKKELPILQLLFANLILTIIGLVINQFDVDIAFAIKYLIRNGLNVLLIFSFLSSKIYFTEKDIDKWVRMILIYQLIIFCGYPF